MDEQDLVMPYGSDYDSDQIEGQYDWQDIEVMDNAAFVPEVVIPAPLYNINKQIEVQQVKQAPKGFQLNEQNASCNICYKFAVDSVLCNNQKCKKLMCLECSRQTTRKNGNLCPFCRVKPFVMTVNPYRTLINQIELKCKLCSQKYILEQEQKHYKLRCSYFHKIKCNYCEAELKKEEIVKHTRIAHEDKIDEIIFEIYNNPPALHDPTLVINQKKTYLTQIGRAPKLGTTGKFYCGSKLEPPKCSCCNGYCGPTNGENCFECMKLDMMRFGLSKGHLVNSEGRVCWREGASFVCKTMNYYGEQRCKEDKPCRPCRNMKVNIERYRDLI